MDIFCRVGFSKPEERVAKEAGYTEITGFKYISLGARVANAGPFTRKRVSVFMHKRCEDGMVRHTKTGTVVARSAHQRTRYKDGLRAGETVCEALGSCSCDSISIIVQTRCTVVRQAVAFKKSTKGT